MPLLLIFIAVPLIEIGLFIQVGGLIGLWPTLLIVLITAILGTSLVRTQGALAMSQLRGSFSELRDPSEPLAHGAMILFAGALLLTPGFFTDAFGFLLLFPPFRSAAFKYIRARVSVQSFEMGGQSGSFHTRSHPHAQASDDIIDGDYDDVSEPKKPTHQPPGVTKH
ncbi:FxsA family protein [Cochlodiniinecator piscidefendens]|uniref:FxsA family protein n=1 Tax=Cochlodiniinecator piscidefendens TaxID=2715756 RepID=UPI00140E7D12|nr:FxsA family protein [Cochlodiniinecator piscidefendens]